MIIWFKRLFGWLVSAIRITRCDEAEPRKARSEVKTKVEGSRPIASSRKIMVVSEEDIPTFIPPPRNMPPIPKSKKEKKP